MRTLFHQFVEAFLLVGRQFFAQLLLNVFIFVVNVRRHLFPKIADAPLGFLDDFVHAGVLFRGQIEFLLNAPHQFHFAQLFQREGLLRRARGGARRIGCGRRYF